LTSLIWLTVALSAAATVAAGYSRNRVPVRASIAIAAVLRIVFALMTSRKYTPKDARIYFKETAQLVLAGKEPLQHLPGREWNFLELMPYIHALEYRLGLPWVYAEKIAPIIADLVIVWLISRLATRDARTRALQYAVNPLSLLVVSLHGQVEPVALAFALGGILMLKRDRLVLAGVLLGAAVAAKSWPVIILLAVLPLTQPKRIARILGGAAIVPAACLYSGVIFLHTDIPHAVVRLLSYAGYVRLWTWSGTVLLLSKTNIAGYYSPLSSTGTALIIIGVAVALYLLRRRPPEVRALGALCAILICTAGFGAQYLLWVLPLAFAISGEKWRTWYTITAAGWAAVFYLPPFTPTNSYGFLRGLSWLPAAMLVALLYEQLRGKPDELSVIPEPPARDPVPADSQVGMPLSFPPVAGLPSEDVSAASLGTGGPPGGYEGGPHPG
jgi:Glycosyltransferase family 87